MNQRIVEYLRLAGTIGDCLVAFQIKIHFLGECCQGMIFKNFSPRSGGLGHLWLQPYKGAANVHLSLGDLDMSDKWRKKCLQVQ